MWLIFLLLFCIVNCTIFPQERCCKVNCSFQMQPFQNKICVIHKAKVCLEPLLNYTQSPEIKLNSEENVKFSISILPYTAAIYNNGQLWNHSAVNISFAIYKNGIDALVIKIKDQRETVCRIFDSESPRIVNNSVPFFYHGTFFTDQVQSQIVRMDMIALPSNEQLTYYVYIPKTDSIKVPCDWQPVIMLYYAKLVDGIVKIKFSHAPQQFKISLYTVELIKESSHRKMSLKVSSDKKVDMLTAEFLSVHYGNYTVIVKPLIEGLDNCKGTKMEVFQVGSSKPALDTITVICICIIIMLALCSFVFYKFCSPSIRLKLFKKRALLVHSYDCDQHEEFVSALIDHIARVAHLEVSTIYGSDSVSEEWTEKVAMEWAKKTFREADIIIFLISEGLLITLDPEDPRRIVVGHKWPSQLPNASNYIFNKLYDSTKDFKKKKTCKICFSYSSELFIPKKLNDDTGVYFMLPMELNHFFCFIHDYHFKIPCTNVYPSVWDDTSEVNRTFLEKLTEVQVQVDQNTHICFVDESVHTVSPNIKERNLDAPELVENHVVDVDVSRCLSNQALMDLEAFREQLPEEVRNSFLEEDFEDSKASSSQSSNEDDLESERQNLFSHDSEGISKSDDEIAAFIRNKLC